MKRLIHIIDSISRWASNAVSLLFLPMTLIATYEVIMRYLFDSPTTWAWDVNVQLFCLIVVFGAANTLLQKGHVIMDVVIGLFSEKTKLWINLLVYVVFIVTVSIVAVQTAIFAWRSILIHERASTLLAPPVYPLKTGIFLGVTLLLLEGISLFVKDLERLFSGPNWKGENKS